jgi:hypothetical protein
VGTSVTATRIFREMEYRNCEGHSGMYQQQHRKPRLSFEVLCWSSTASVQQYVCGKRATKRSLQAAKFTARRQTSTILHAVDTHCSLVHHVPKPHTLLRCVRRD